jgi:nucleotide-binding universal stress UspA family protein
MVVECAQTCLRAAQEAVDGTDSMVKIETAILEGSPSQMLVAESDHAAMVCVGSVGIGRFVRACPGSTATEVAEGAHCSVAVIHGSVPRRRPEHGAISVEVDDSAENDDVIAAAVAEAQSRSLPIVAVGVCAPETGISSRQELARRVAMWRERYPDLQITAKPVPTGLARFLAKATESIELAVISSDHATDLPTIIGPHTEEAGCSVLIVRS